MPNGAGPPAPFCCLPRGGRRVVVIADDGSARNAPRQWPLISRNQELEIVMTVRLSIMASAIILASTIAAGAQGIGANGGTSGSSSVLDGPVAPQPSPSASGVSSAPGNATLSPGSGTTGRGGGRSQPGAPNTTTPGTIGTGAAPSGLPGDNPSAPGFPGKVGN